MKVAVFKSTLPSMNYVFKDGMTLPFLNGRAEVDITRYANELAAECENVGYGKSRHPHIYIDENEQMIDTEAMTPMEILKAKVREELLEEMKAAQAPDASTSTQGSFAASVATTANIAAASESDSGAPANMSASDLIAAAKAAK